MHLKLLQKEQFKKTAEATGDLISNKIANKIPRVSKHSQKNCSEAVINESAKLHPEDVLGSSPKNLLMSSRRLHIIIYVTPRDASLSVRPWDVLRTSI